MPLLDLVAGRLQRLREGCPLARAEEPQRWVSLGDGTRAFGEHLRTNQDRLTPRAMRTLVALTELGREAAK